MQVPHQSVTGQSQLGAAPALSFGSSEDVLALVENQSLCDASLIHQATAVSAAPDVSALAFSDEVVQQLLTMLIKPEPAVINKPVHLPVIVETPGSVNPDPPFKPCPNVLQTRSFPQPQSAGAGGLSVFTSPPVNSATVGATKIAAVTGSDAAESRSWDSLIQLLMGNSAGESRRNSTGSLRGQSNTSGFRVPQVHNGLLPCDAMLGWYKLWSCVRLSIRLSQVGVC